MRTIKFFTNPITEYVEGQNCSAINDVRGEYPVVKIYIKNRIRVYKGIPYVIEVEANHDIDDRHFQQPGPGR